MKLLANPVVSLGVSSGVSGVVRSAIDLCRSPGEVAGRSASRRL